MRAAHYVCLTSELEMGCMVPCSRMGEVKEEEEEEEGCRGNKRKRVWREKRRANYSFRFVFFFTR